MDEHFYREVASGRVEPVLDNLKFLYQAGVHLEITTLIIPTLSDGADMLKRLTSFIAHELSPKVPWHISRFSAGISWKLKNLPDTDAAALKKAYEIGKQAGLKYVYAGGFDENTYCSACQETVIKRSFYHTLRRDKDGKCPKCQEKLDIII